MTKAVNTRTINNVKLTALEIDVLKNGLYYNEYNNHTIENIDKNGYERNYPVIWADSVSFDCKTAKPKQVAAIVASLNKKGLTKSEGEGKDAVVIITEAGIEILRTLVAEDIMQKEIIVTKPEAPKEKPVPLTVSKIEKEIADGTTPFEFDGEPLIIAPAEPVNVEGLTEPIKIEEETEPEFRNRYLSILRPLGMWYSPRDPTVKFKIVNPTEEDKKHCPEWVSMVYDALITDKPLSEEEVKHMTFVKAHVVEEAEPEIIEEVEEEAEPEEVELIAKDDDSETFHLRVISKDEFFDAEEIGGELIKLGEGEKRQPEPEIKLNHVTIENGFTEDEIESAKEIIAEFVEAVKEDPEPEPEPEHEPEILLPEAKDRGEPKPISTGNDGLRSGVHMVLFDIFSDAEREIAYEVLKEWKKEVSPIPPTEKTETETPAKQPVKETDPDAWNVYRLTWIENGEQKHKDYMKKPVAVENQKKLAGKGINASVNPRPIEISDWAWKATGQTRPVKANTEKKTQNGQKSGNKGGKTPSASVNEMVMSF